MFGHLIVVGALLAVVSPSALKAQSSSPVSQQAKPGGTAGAAEAGATAGASKSTTGLAIGTGLWSVAIPGAGFINLLLLKEGEVQPNFTEQAFLRDKSPDYTKVWVASYDRALTQKQKKTIIVSSTVGTVAALVMYKALLRDPGY